MELTPQLLETQQFPEKFRGYDCDAVDDFLERVGVAVGELQDRVKASEAKADELSKTASQTPAPVAAAVVAAPAADAPSTLQTGADQISRALILAQQAADEAVAEAKREAADLTAAARLDTAKLRDDAEKQSAEMRRQAEATAAATERGATEQRDRILAEARIEAERALAKARSESAELKARAEAEVRAEAEAQRTKVNAELDQLQLVVDRRRKDSETLTEMVSSRRSQLGDIVRDLDVLNERLEEITGDGGGGTAVETSEVAHYKDAVIVDLTSVEAPEEETADVEEPVGVGSRTAELARDDSVPQFKEPSAAHPAGSEAPTLPRWATVDETSEASAVPEPAAETAAPSGRPDLHVVSTPIADEPVAPPIEEPAAHAAHLAPAPESVPAPSVMPEPVARPTSPFEAALARTAEEPSAAPEATPLVAPSADGIDAPTAPEEIQSAATIEAAVAQAPVAAAVNGRSDNEAALDDPFLAALRGREPLDGDDEAGRRRRRRRW
ncbi:MAG: DivIVA domain-containing protein [Candidatus Poriferisodalaceae bacterium]|jgi:DivIVA domain-containing protein